jgi:hypothetical protein
MKTLKFLAIFYLALASIQALGMDSLEQDSNPSSAQENTPVMAAQTANVSPIMPSYPDTPKILPGHRTLTTISPLMTALSLNTNAPLQSRQSTGQKRTASGQDHRQSKKIKSSDFMSIDEYHCHIVDTKDDSDSSSSSDSDSGSESSDDSHDSDVIRYNQHK